jgi:hypothetical protein
MAAPGFVDLPSTQHFAFEYSEQLNDSDARSLGKALLGTAERDFATLSSWFGGSSPRDVPLDVKINPGNGGASNDRVHTINLRLGATANVNLARCILVAEVMEIFMAATASGWNPTDSSGEGLSQLAGFTLYPDQKPILNGPQVWLDTSISPSAAKPSRPDFVSTTEGTDRNFVSFGCALLFLYYLRSQLGFSMRALLLSAADSLEGVFDKLTQDRGAFQTFSNILEERFPPGKPCGLVGSADPFPLATSESLSTKQFMARSGMDPKLLGQVVRSKKDLGNLRAVLNSNRPASLLR